MQLFQNIDSGSFKLNGKKFVKNFIILPIGEDAIAVYNAYDSRMQLLPATHFSQVAVGGVTFPSQELLIDELAPMLFAKQLVSLSGLEQDELIDINLERIDDEIFIYAGGVWRLSGELYSNDNDFSYVVPAASSGATRIDIIVATNEGWFEAIQGDEDEENPTAPVIPNGTLLVTTVTIIGETIINETPFLIPDAYVMKIESHELEIYFQGVLNNFVLPSYMGAIRHIGTCSQWNGVSFNNVVNQALYSGKRFVVKNFQAMPIRLKHNYAGTATYKFFFPNGEDFILEPNNIAEFALSFSSSRLEYIGKLQTAEPVIPNLQQVLDEGSFASGHTIVLQQAYNSDSRVDINLDDFFEPYLRIRNGGVGSSGHWTNIGSSTIEFDGNGDFKTTLIGSTGGEDNTLKVPSESGVLATREYVMPMITGLTASVSSAATVSNVWVNGDGTRTNNINSNTYRTGSVILTGGTISYNTNNGNSAFGTSFGHITGSGGITGFIQMFSQGNNGGMINPIVSSFTGASTTQAQQVFSAVKSTAYDKWTDSRLLYSFKNGYGTNETAAPTLFNIGTDYLQFNQYPTSRTDSGATTNYLSTDSSGKLVSKPVSGITGTDYSSQINLLSGITSGHTSEIATINSNVVAMSGVNNTQTSQLSTLSGLLNLKLDRFINKETYWSIPAFNASTLSVQGAGWVFSNGPSARQYSSTNGFTRTTRLGIESTLTAGTLGGGRQNPAHMSRTDNFEAWYVFGASTNANLTGVRYHVGITIQNFSSAVDPSTYTNCMLFARLASSNNWHIVHNDAAGTATVVDTGLSANTIESDIMVGYINNTSAGTSFILTNKVTGASFTYSTTSDLPAVTQGLASNIGSQNNTNASVVGLDFFGNVITFNRTF